MTHAPTLPRWSRPDLRPTQSSMGQGNLEVVVHALEYREGLPVAVHGERGRQVARAATRYQAEARKIAAELAKFACSIAPWARPA
jgi:hypothetical protein